MKMKEKKTISNFKPNEYQIKILEHLDKNEEGSSWKEIRSAAKISERWFSVNMNPLKDYGAVDHVEKKYHIKALGRVLLQTSRGLEVSKNDVEAQKRKDFRRVWNEVQRVHKKSFWFGTPAIDFDANGKPFFKEVNIPERHTLPGGRHVDLNALWVMAYKTKDGEPRMIVKIPTVEEMREQGFDV